MTDLVCVGEILIDLTQTGVTEQGVPLLAANPGGAPANVAVAAARLGVRTAFLGKTGRDGFGAYLARVLRENGVDVSGLRTGSEATTLAVVTIDPTGERSFRFVRGADRSFSPEDVSVHLLEQTKALHFGSVSLTGGPARAATLFAAREARRLGLLVSYDPNYRASLWEAEAEAVQWMRTPLPLVDVLKLSEEELPLLTGVSDWEKGTRLLEEQGVRLQFLTLGEKGVFCRFGGQSALIPGVAVHVADTNGAGDTFLGAVLSRLLPLGPHPLDALDFDVVREIAAFANRAAALTCSRSGAIPAMPSLAELSEG